MYGFDGWTLGVEGLGTRGVYCGSGAPAWDLSLCGAGAAYRFRKLLVISHITSPCGLGLQFCFHPWGVSWVFLGHGILCICAWDYA